MLWLVMDYNHVQEKLGKLADQIRALRESVPRWDPEVDQQYRVLNELYDFRDKEMELRRKAVQDGQERCESIKKEIEGIEASIYLLKKNDSVSIAKARSEVIEQHIKELDATMSRHEFELISIQDRRNALGEDQKELKQLLAESGDYSNDKFSVKARIEMMEKSIALMEQTLGEESEELGLRVDLMEDAEDIYTSFKDRVNRVRCSIDFRSKNESQDEYESATLQELEEYMEVSEQELDESTQILEAARQMVECSRAAVSEYEKRFDKMLQDRYELRKELEKLENAPAVRQKRITELQHRIPSESQYLDQREQELGMALEFLREELDDLIQTGSEATQDLLEIQKRFERRGEVLQEQRSRVMDLEQGLARARRHISELEDHHAQRIHDLEVNIEKQKEEIMATEGKWQEKNWHAISELVRQEASLFRLLARLQDLKREEKEVFLPSEIASQMIAPIATPLSRDVEEILSSPSFFINRDYDQILTMLRHRLI